MGLARAGVAAPLVERLEPAPDPLEACERLRDLPYCVWLDAGPSEALAAGTGARRYGYLVADPAIVLRDRGGLVERLAAPGGAWEPLAADLLDAARAELAPHRAAPLDGLPPFQGGLAGFIGYECGARLEGIASPPGDDAPLPDAVLGLYDWVLAWDHASGAAWIVSTGLPERGAARRERARHRVEMVKRRLADGRRGERAEGLAAPPSALPPFRPPAVTHPVPGHEPIGLRSTFTRDAYLAAVERVREYVRAGDIFQANLSQRFEAPLGEPAWALYRRLRRRNPAPFGAWLELPEAAVLSVSPERFLWLASDGAVETRPIKGTRPRGRDAAEDAALALALAASEKDRAENVMIVDLLRNDLARVCEAGSVRVPSLLALESHPTVHHLVSTVTGRLAPGRDAFDLLRATLPGGSITGAPKVRAMEIIAELEPAPRGVYCGAIGWVSVTGAMDTSVAIRTAVAAGAAGAGARLSFAAGGGIVLDSDPAAEYDETLAKARAFIEALRESADGEDAA